MLDSFSHLDDHTYPVEVLLENITTEKYSTFMVFYFKSLQPKENETNCPYFECQFITGDTLKNLFITH